MQQLLGLTWDLLCAYVGRCCVGEENKRDRLVPRRHIEQQGPQLRAEIPADAKLLERGQ